MNDGFNSGMQQAPAPQRQPAPAPHMQPAPAAQRQTAPAPHMQPAPAAQRQTAPAPHMQPAPAAQRETIQQQVKFDSYHVYGSKSALCFNFSYRDEKPVVNIDGAKALGKKVYDWNNKVSLLVGANEWPRVLCVLLGFAQSAEFKFHGQNRNKGFSFVLQDADVCCKVFGPNFAIAVPINRNDVFHLSAKLMGHYSSGMPGIRAGDLPNLLLSTYMRFE